MNEKTLVLEILKRDVDVNAKGSNGCTSLSYASMYCDIEVMKLLIDKGGDIHSQDNYKKTPAHYAA